MQTATNADEQRKMTVSCVDHWAARLSHSNDSAQDVAEATIGACLDAVQYLASFMAKEERAQSVAGEQPYSANLNDLIDEFRRKALFRVVQWRAGKCPTPDI